MRVLGVVATLAQAACWSGDVSFTRCCLRPHGHGDPACWTGGYTYDSCCFRNVLTPADVNAIQTMTRANAHCCPDRDRSFWCKVREASMLSWDLRGFYVPMLEMNVEDVAKCPAGMWMMILLDAFLKHRSGMQLHTLPAFAWADEFFEVAVGAGKLRELVRSGFHPFFLAVPLREPDPKTVCGRITHGERNFSAVAERAVTYKHRIPVSPATVFLSSRPRCRVGSALAAWAAAIALEHLDEPAEDLFALAHRHLAGKRPLWTLAKSAWPFMDILEFEEHERTVEIPVGRPLEEFGFRQLRPPLSAAGAYRQRVFPDREIASDLIRYSNSPFCGMRPFLRLIDSVAQAEVRPFSLIEGGPHLGDCTLWAAAALKHAQVPFRALGIDAMGNAAALFKESVRVNGFERVQVLHRALDEASGREIAMRHVVGRNGQATTARLYEQCEDCVEVAGVKTATLDEEWSGELDILKLSVNGAELRTLQGATKLLQKRHICSVLMHASKVQMGRESAQFSTELFHVLRNNGMDWTHYNDQEDKGVQGPGGGQSTQRKIESAEELDALFRAGVTEQDYLFAQLQEPRCQHIRQHVANAMLPRTI